MKSIHHHHMAVVLSAVLFSGTLAHGQSSPLDATYEAHGGLAQWQRQRTFTYTLEGFPLSPQVAKVNHSTVDLRRWHPLSGD